MCELLGLCFNKKADIQMTYYRFQRHGQHNPHGWGFAYYPDKSCQIFKEGIEAGVSALSKYLRNYHQDRSKIYIAHVRYATRGSHSHMNAHPFAREILGIDYVLAHNGTIEDLSQLPLTFYKPVGETDSEHVFCYLAGQIRSYLLKKRKKRLSPRDFSWLHDEFLKINEYGKFNCLMSDGLYLFAYYDLTFHNGLTFTKRKYPFKVICYEDEDFCVDLSTMKKKNEYGFIVATRPLTKEIWAPFHPGELLVFKNGEIVYTSHPQHPPLERLAEKRIFSLGVTEVMILEYLARTKKPLTVRGLARKLDFEISLIRHSLNTLVGLGYVSFQQGNTPYLSDPNARYQIAPARLEEVREVIQKEKEKKRR